MPSHNGCKGGVISLSQEAPKHLPVGHPGSVVQQHGIA
jgi:hypothetical protein